MRWSIYACVIVLAGVATANAEEVTLRQTALTMDEHGFVGTLFEPADAESPVAVIVLGGSQGATPTYRAQAVAEAGYRALALAYFGEPGLPTHLDVVPLEPALRAIGWMHDELLNGNGRVVLIGGSKGAELALLLASIESTVRGVVAVAPSHVVFQGIPENFWPARSSWMHDDEPVPFVPYRYGPHFNPFAEEPDFHALYRESLTQEPLVEQAAIAVESINGPALLFSGGQDRMWPATDMANRIIERLEAHDHPHRHKHHVYEDAGHIIHEHAGEWATRFGGSAEANRDAGRDAWRRILDLLATLEHASSPHNGDHHEPGD